MQLSFFAGELAEGGMQQDQCGKIITENIPYSDKGDYNLIIISVNPRLKDDICKASDFPQVSHIVQLVNADAGSSGARCFLAISHLCVFFKSSFIQFDQVCLLQ